MDPEQVKFLAEEVILVDQNDVAIGHMSKKESHILPGSLHRAFSIFMFNSKYELLLQQRSAEKITFPLVWSNTVCSHPLYFDEERVEEDALGVRRAAVRKADHECGLKLNVDDLKWITRIRYSAPCDDKWGETEVDYCLFIVSDEVANPNPNEVASVQYVSQEKLRDMMEEHARGDGVTLSPWFLRISQKFLFGWWDALKAGKLGDVVDHKTITYLPKD